MHDELKAFLIANPSSVAEYRDQTAWVMQRRQAHLADLQPLVAHLEREILACEEILAFIDAGCPGVGQT